MKDRYTIWDELRRMQHQMDAMFENFFESSGPSSHYLLPRASNKNDVVVSTYREPVSDIYETEKEIIAEIEIPGVDKKDIQVNVDSNGIDVKAETKTESKHEDKKKGMYRFERNYSGFYRHFSLPNNVNTEKATAEYKDGVLKVVVPKLKVEESKRKLLEVK